MWADPEMVEAKAQSDWTAEQIECRLNRHWWTREYTLLTSHPGGAKVVRQLCARGCGVGRRNTMSRSGHLLKHWQMDYSSDLAKQYLMKDTDGKPAGRVDADGMARLRLLSFAGLGVAEPATESVQ